jgi:energy-coupling factor transporter ATP-binding protein EcfA2
MITIEGLSFSYQTYPILRDIGLHVDDGEVVGLLGATGSGKTTLLRCMNGIIPQAVKGHMEGQVIVDGWDTREHSLAEFSKKVGYVFQNPNDQIVTHTVTDELCFGPRNLGILNYETVSDVAQEMGIIHLMHKSVHSLSGGEKQKVAIASVLTMEPTAILFDEPLSNLDFQGVRAFHGIISNALRDKTIVIAEHNSWLLAPVLTRVLVIDSVGRIAMDGPARKIFSRLDELKYLGIEPDPKEETFQKLNELLEVRGF